MPFNINPLNLDHRHTPSCLLELPTDARQIGGALGYVEVPCDLGMATLT